MSFVQLTMAPSCRKAMGRDKTQMIRLVIASLLMRVLPCLRRRVPQDCCVRMPRGCSLNDHCAFWKS